jgi:hypothetical protein
MILDLRLNNDQISKITGEGSAAAVTVDARAGKPHRDGRPAGTAAHGGRPPCAPATAATIARPRPVLPLVCPRELSPRANRSNAVGRIDSGTPGPSSLTAICTTPATSGRVTASVTVVPVGVCTRAFVSRLATTWCNRNPSPITTTGSSGSSSRHSWSRPAA